jgi:hypothetical protein
MFRAAYRSSSGPLNCICNFWFTYKCGDRPLSSLSGNSYFSSDVELQKCKEPTKQRYVCKQNKPLLSSLVQEVYAVRLLKVWKNVTDSCEMYFVQMIRNLWTQLMITSGFATRQVQTA